MALYTHIHHEGDPKKQIVKEIASIPEFVFEEGEGNRSFYPLSQFFSFW